MTRKEQKLTELLKSKEGNLPEWVRAPKTGSEYYCGLSRAKLYELAGKKKIRSVSIREPGQVRGSRLFHLRSILDFVEQCEKDQAAAMQPHSAALNLFETKKQNPEPREAA